MGFTDADRTIQTQTANDVKWIKTEHGRRLKELEKEDKVLHHRVNDVRQLFGGITAVAGAVITGVVGYFKFKGD